MPTQEEKNWAIIVHLAPIVIALFSFMLLQYLAPLLILLLKRGESEFVTEHARQSLNFQLTIFAVTIALTILGWLLVASIIGSPPGALILCFVLPCLYLAEVVFAVLAAIKASEGKPYTYPVAIPFVTIGN